MSYAMSFALQEALYRCLTADTHLNALVGNHIYDALPAGTPPDLYVILGAEKVRDASDADGDGAVHEVSVSILTERAGFADAKRAAVAVCDALGVPLDLSRGRLLSLRFHKARAGRVGSAGRRRIDLTFNARLSDD